MTIQLSDHFTYKKLLQFVMPSVMMMVFTSIYGIVDGFFVSNYVGKTPFAALNLIYPVIQIISAIGFMFGSGGSAIVGKTLGEGDNLRARKYFTLIVFSAAALGLIFSMGTIPFLRPLSILLKADGEMIGFCVEYGRILLYGMPFFILQNVFQSLMITSGKPHLGFIVTVIAGVTNMFLDYLFIVPFEWGLAGAAWATVVSQVVGAVIPVIYFAKENGSLLCFTKTEFYGKVLLKTCTNGMSELISNISASVVGILYNVQLMKYAGENGVAAYGTAMYVTWFFVAIAFGYAVGCSPIVSYNYGAQNHAELKNIFKKSMIISTVLDISLVLLLEIFLEPMARAFVGYDAELFEMTCRSLRICEFCFLVITFNIFGSAFFTALNNGVISAVVSVLRTIVFNVATVMILPHFFGLDGIWASVTVTEFLAFIPVLLCFIIFRKRYHYA